MQKPFFPLLVAAGLLAGPNTAQSDDRTVTISSQPTRVAQVGIPYEYDIAAVSSNPQATVTYALDTNPAGMVIDPGTGHIRWTPEHAAVYAVKIHVRVMVGSSAVAEAEQEYPLRVLNVSQEVPEVSGHGAN